MGRDLAKKKKGGEKENVTNMLVFLLCISLSVLLRQVCTTGQKRATLQLREKKREKEKG